VEKLISNPSQAYSLGGTWGTPSVDNSMTSDVCWLINGTGQILYTSDIVCLDLTGTQAILAAATPDQYAIGTVGSPLGMSTMTSTTDTVANVGFITTPGDNQPLMIAAPFVATLGFTNGSSTVTYGSASVNDIGKLIYTPYNASTNLNPQIFLITAATANTNYTVTGYLGGAATFGGTTGSFSCTVGYGPQNMLNGFQNPIGWTSASAFAMNAIVPVVVRGYGRVNINGVAATVARDNITTASGSVIGTRTASAGIVAAGIGMQIAVTLEAYAARDVTLTTAGTTGHDSVRAIIGKF
jgi:hypothetical protein